MMTLSSAALMGQLTPVTPRIARASASTSPEVAGTGVCTAIVVEITNGCELSHLIDT